jgi:hypothetical protein
MLATQILHCAPVAVQVIGSPGEEDIAFVSSDKARRYLRSLPPCPRADFKKLYPHADEQVCRGVWTGGRTASGVTILKCGLHWSRLVLAGVSEEGPKRDPKVCRAHTSGWRYAMLMACANPFCSRRGSVMKLNQWMLAWSSCDCC